MHCHDNECTNIICPATLLRLIMNVSPLCVNVTRLLCVCAACLLKGPDGGEEDVTQVLFCDLLNILLDSYSLFFLCYLNLSVLFPYFLQPIFYFCQNLLCAHNIGCMSVCPARGVPMFSTCSLTHQMCSVGIILPLGGYFSQNSPFPLSPLYYFARILSRIRGSV